MYLQNLASIQLRTSLVEFDRSPRTDPPGAMDPKHYGEIADSLNRRATKLQAKAKALESDIERLTEAMKAEMIREKKGPQN